MDCRQTQDALAAARDDRDAVLSAHASEHAAACPECAAFSEALVSLDAIPSPAAPAGLAERILDAVAIEAVLIAEETPAARAAVGATASPAGESPPQDGATLPAGTPVVPAWLTRTRLWAATGSLTLAAAGIAIAVIVTSQAAQQTALKEAAQQDLQYGSVGNVEASGTVAAAPPAAVTPAVPLTAPDYVAFQTFAYIAGATTAATPSQATTAGTTQTALQGVTVQTLDVLRVSGSARDLVLALPSGEYQTLTPVTRTFGTTTFQLRSGPALDRFGAWPTLPPDYKQPTGADGSPYYRTTGTDALGVRVYVRVGEMPERGFGIAPGTTATDPASGNPNWTWWSPVQ
jgi:hypothetical protein